jgi:hypothetical protein
MTHLLHRFLIFYADLIWKKCMVFFCKKMAVETDALSIVEITQIWWDDFISYISTS